VNAPESQVSETPLQASVGVRSHADLRPQQENDAPENEAFELLVRRQSRFVFQVAYAMIRNSHDAEDVVQETFLSLYRSGAWRNMKEERAFLARATWRQAIDRLRATPRHQENDANILLDLPSREEDPEQTLLDTDKRAAVHRLIDALPEELRQPLALSTVQELNSREIATILDIPEGTVRTRLMRARQLLKQKLAAQIEVRYAS
jgi:RNA polymerase sigma-70 factor (ECF subfamily)